MARGVLWLWVTVVVAVAVGSMVVQASSTQGAISVDPTGGYKGVVVALSDTLNQDNCSHYINNIKAIFEDASSLMYNATGERLFFGVVTIVIPRNWSCTEDFTDTIDHNWESAHIRVGMSHDLFSDAPWTQQAGGCGDPGDFIFLAHNFVLTDTITTNRKGQTLVHEWAKFRWGAFEEYGHAGDSTYPTVYRSNEIFRPNYCTDVDIPGTCSCSDDCSVEGEEKDCTFTPDLSLGDNTTISSSLLAAPFIDTVVKFCDHSTHNNATTTKHNILCDQRSTWEVITQHSDLQGSSGVVFGGTQFRTVKATPERTTIVFLVEYTGVMGEMPSRWEFLRDSLLQYILVEAPDSSRAGVVIFNNGVTIDSSILYELVSDTERQNLASFIPTEKPTTPNSKNIEPAITRGVEILGDTGGWLVLLTANTVEYNTGGQDLVEAASGNPVWPILYPSDPSVSSQVFQDLADISTKTSLLVVPDEYDDIFESQIQSTDTNVLLTDSLRQATHIDISFNTSDRGTTDGGSLSVDLTLEVQSSTEYVGGLMIEVLSNPFMSAATMSGPYVDAPEKSIQETSIVFSFNDVKVGTYVVTVLTDIKGVPVVARAGGVPKATDVVVDVWAPRGLEDLSFEPGVAPRFFATVEMSDGRRIVNANVQAKIQRTDGQGQPVTVVMRDGGVAGDVTGNDGVYTGVVASYEPGVTVEVTVTANDNNGTARAVGKPVRAPVSPDDGQACCGSQLDLSGLQLDEVSPFSISSAPGIRGRLTGDPPGDFPPGRVTDLRSGISGWKVTLTFTAPGARLDQEKANHYEAIFRTPGDGTSTQNITAQDVGTEVSSTMKLPDCNKVYTITVVAVDSNSLRGKDSNPVQEIVSCSYKSGGLSDGAIAGIVIGCILGILLLILLVYLCLNRDHLDELWVWKVLTCRYCCKTKKDDDRLYNPPAPKSSRNVDVIRKEISRPNPPVQPIRSIDDLYAKPDLEAKHTNRLKKEDQRQQQTEESDDGGFSERHRRNVFPLRPAAAQTNLNQKSRYGDVSSRSSTDTNSTQTTQPINQVGLPPSRNYNHGYQPSMARDNRAYDSTGDTYNNNYYNNPTRPPTVPPRSRQAPMPPRHNTQV